MNSRTSGCDLWLPHALEKKNELKKNIYNGIIIYYLKYNWVYLIITCTNQNNINLSSFYNIIGFFTGNFFSFILP